MASWAVLTTGVEQVLTSEDSIQFDAIQGEPYAVGFGERDTGSIQLVTDSPLIGWCKIDFKGTIISEKFTTVTLVVGVYKDDVFEGCHGPNSDTFEISSSVMGTGVVSTLVSHLWSETRVVSIRLISEDEITLLPGCRVIITELRN